MLERFAQKWTNERMNINGKEIVLDIVGLGIVFYSPGAARHIAEGDNYLASNYTTAQQVQSHIQKGTIVGFGTASPGTFILKFHSGYPDETSLQNCDYKLRLGLHCPGGLVCFKDLYELMDWHADCPPNQVLELDDGFYHVTLCSNRPASGVLGDKQEILVYLQKLDAFPRLAKEGIPMLCM
jgi:hypothetical protein